MEVWTERPGDGALCGLISGEIGWLMSLRAPGDAGFSSRNPAYAGPHDALIEDWLDNGQRDRSPASGAVDTATIVRALREFLETGAGPSGVAWHDDAGTR